MKKGQRRKEQKTIAEMRWLGFLPDPDEQDLDPDDPDQEFVEGEALEQE